MIVSELLRTVSFILSDTGHVTYKEPDLIDAVNNGCRMVVIYRPDACSTIAQVTLNNGSLQELPDHALRLLDSYYNESGRPIQMVNRKDVDRVDPYWQQMEPESEIQEIMYDERIPESFYVLPPAIEGTRIQVGYSIMPNVVQSVDDEFPLPDKYSPAVIEWMLYQLFSLDNRNMQSQQQAMAHNQQFFNILQVKTQGDAMVAPGTSQAGSAEQ